MPLTNVKGTAKKQKSMFKRREGFLSPSPTLGGKNPKKGLMLGK